VARTRCRDHPNVLLLKEDARALSFGPGSFDAVFSYGDVLSHIVDGYETALSEMSRVARPGALITFEVDNKWHPGIFYTPGELVRNLVSPGHGHAGRKWNNLSFRTFTYHELRRLLNRHGMDIVEFHGHNMLASLIPDRYVLERTPRTFGGRTAIWLGRIDLDLSDVFPFNRMGFNSIVVARKR
jgi:SAM-dependent methyltransferase